MRRLTVLAAALAVAACTPDFDPASKIEKLRVVAIQAEPPELDPAGIQTATLTSLVLRADYATTTRTTTVVHVACVPVPGDPSPTFCVALSNLVDAPARIAALARVGCSGGAPVAPGVALPPWSPILFGGIETCTDAVCAPAAVLGTTLQATAAVPAGFTFSPARPPDADPRWEERVAAERKTGVYLVDLAFAVDATPEELVQGVGTSCAEGDLAGNLAALWATREHVLSVKRVAIRGPESPNAANRNPAVAGISVSGVTLDPAGTTSVAAGKLELTPVLPAGPAAEPEVYTKLDADGAFVERGPEKWVYSWFSTAGEIKDLHTRSVGKVDEWTVRDPGPARVVVVVRDLRGGTSWAVRDVVVAP